MLAPKATKATKTTKTTKAGGLDEDGCVIHHDTLDTDVLFSTLEVS